MEKEGLLNSREAQQILFFWTPKTIRCYASDGRLPSVKVGGRTYFRESELREFVSKITKERKGGNHESSGNFK